MGERECCLVIPIQYFLRRNFKREMARDQSRPAFTRAMRSRSVLFGLCYISRPNDQFILSVINEVARYRIIVRCSSRVQCNDRKVTRLTIPLMASVAFGDVLLTAFALKSSFQFVR